MSVCPSHAPIRAMVSPENQQLARFFSIFSLTLPYDYNYDFFFNFQLIMVMTYSQIRKSYRAEKKLGMQESKGVSTPYRVEK